MPETLREPKSGFSKPSKMGLFKEDIDMYERKPFNVNYPTVSINSSCIVFTQERFIKQFE